MCSFKYINNYTFAEIRSTLLLINMDKYCKNDQASTQDVATPYYTLKNSFRTINAQISLKREIIFAKYIFTKYF